MRCERAQELFSDYCEGTVQVALRVPLEDHLSACEECRVQVADLRSLWTMLDDSPVVEPPADFRAAVWSRIDRAEADKRAAARPLFSFEWRHAFSRPALAWGAAACLLVVLAGAVIPGRFTAAGLYFPWSAVRSEPSRQTTQPPAATFGEPRLRSGAGPAALELPFRKTTDAPIAVQVTVTAGPDQLVGHTQAVVLTGPRDVTGAVALDQLLANGWDGEPINLRLAPANGPAEYVTFARP